MSATSIFLLVGCSGSSGQAILDSPAVDTADDTAAVVDDTGPAPGDDTEVDTVEPSPTVWPALVINEFMASNQSTITDETGSYGDWIELYNPTEEAVELGGWLISDDLESPDEWVLDDALSIEAGGRLRVIRAARRHLSRGVTATI